MKWIYVVLAGCMALFISGCNNEAAPQENDAVEEDAEAVLADVARSSENSIAKADMINTSGQSIGTVHFYDNDHSVMMEALFNEGIPAGFHGFHIHETGVCDPNASDGPFTSAGGHYNPQGTNHGSHAGDMPSLYGLEDGSSYLLTALDRFSPQQVANEQRAVIVHTDANNFANIPDRYTSDLNNQSGPDEETLKTGDAGDRLACGVIEPSR
ncbi:superoxide dismutase, Cu-Zn family [Alteribacillus persepolensis]|uniref:Superoxide dismutase [Cu-Zn] n=1 Tax=Alteribacillus persepolensis TaxID=568899 RepID=A0A1G8C5U8_9BACI|nr:superoxide dismutase family protein [Alteribacillus persepolensis]SDH40649.1 superoxide dismutase, Cu-Zn family [Alteribacillus persepolensis]